MFFFGGEREASCEFLEIFVIVDGSLSLFDMLVDVYGPALGPTPHRSIVYLEMHVTNLHEYTPTRFAASYIGALFDRSVGRESTRSVANSDDKGEQNDMLLNFQMM